ncbi:MAG TPA: NAD(P)H-binding protein [Edaphocola sp.]|nr:NAD(P)H-binding protein [Edaphocola sp.]
MKVILIGATGATGKALVKHLIEDVAISEIMIFGRKSFVPAHPKIANVLIDFDEMEDYAGQIHADLAFSCLGTTLKAAGSKEAQWKIDYDYQLNFAKICKQKGVHTFILVSALGANAQSKIFYSRMKGALDEAVKHLGFKKTIIFKPSALIRPGSDRKGEGISIKILNVLNAVGLFKFYRPIATETLARQMLKAAKDKTLGYFEFSGSNINL